MTAVMKCAVVEAIVRHKVYLGCDATTGGVGELAECPVVSAMIVPPDIAPTATLPVPDAVTGLGVDGQNATKSPTIEATEPTSPTSLNWRLVRSNIGNSTVLVGVMACGGPC